MLEITSRSLLDDDRSSSKCELNKNLTKNLSDLFTTLSEPTSVHPNKILIEGAPEIGKTVLSKEVAYQWAQSKILCSKKLLFLVFLCDFSPSDQIKSVDDFVHHLCKNTEKATKIAEYVINNNKDIAILLDSYDELSEQDRTASFVADIINHQVLSKCLLIITSRATASLHFHDSADCMVEIASFTEKDRLVTY